MNNPDPSDKNDRLIAALLHCGVLLPLIGIIGAIIVNASRGDSSRFLRFQSRQVLVYLIVAMIILLTVFFASFIVMIFSFDAMRSTSVMPVNGKGIPSAFLAIQILMGCIMTPTWFGTIGLGLFAAYKTSKGDNYHYPIIGKLVSARMR